MDGVDGGCWCWVFAFLCFSFVEMDGGPSFYSFRVSPSVVGCVKVCVGWGGGEVFCSAHCDGVCACPAGGVGADDWSWSLWSAPLMGCLAALGFARIV